MKLLKVALKLCQSRHDFGMTLYVWTYYTVLYKRITFDVDFQIVAANTNKNITALITGEKFDES